MPRRFIIVATAVIFALAAFAFGEEQAKANGRIVFSDGLELEGIFYTTAGKKFTINDPERQKTIEFAVTDIVYIKQTVESESMEKKWVFKELGTEEKIKKEVEYPVRIYLTEVKLKDGTTVKGHVIGGVLYMEADGEKIKYVIRRQEKGDEGQVFDDLKYVVELSFSEDEQKGNEYAGKIAGKIKSAEKILEAYAVSYKLNRAFKGEVRDFEAEYEIKNLPEGLCDAVFVAEKRIVFGLGVADERQKEKPLDENDVKAVKKRVEDSLKHSESFYDAIDAVKIEGGGVGGGKKEARLFVVKSRKRPSTFDGLTGKAHDLYRYEYWLMHEFDGKWEIDKQIYITRQMIEEKSGVKPYTAEWSGRLSLLEVKKDMTARLDLE